MSFLVRLDGLLMSSRPFISMSSLAAAWLRGDAVSHYFPAAKFGLNADPRCSSFHKPMQPPNQSVSLSSALNYSMIWSRVYPSFPHEYFETFNSEAFPHVCSTTCAERNHKFCRRSPTYDPRICSQPQTTNSVDSRDLRPPSTERVHWSK